MLKVLLTTIKIRRCQRLLFMLLIAILCQGCRHPLGIIGEGDIYDHDTGMPVCTLEDARAAAAACTENNVAARDYNIVYQPLPRDGWRFVEWRGTACGVESIAPLCEYRVSRQWVDYVNAVWPDLVIPPTIAVFAPQDAMPPVIISGNVSFTAYNPTSQGLDYDNPQNRPVRGALIRLLDDSGAELATTSTDETGRYQLSAPAYSTLTLVVHAALGAAGSMNTIVIDNTNAREPYALNTAAETEAADITLDIHAESGWSGGIYDSPRDAAPFAILDTIYIAQEFVRGAIPDAEFSPLFVNWSPHNTPVTEPMDIGAGQLPSSFYFGGPNGTGEMYVLGAQDVDTDEYDESVVTHEWVHYFEATFSRSDSIGGAHDIGDLLDPTVSFSEGLSNALAALITGKSDFVDTAGPGQGEVKAYENLESDRFGPADIAAEDQLTPLDGPYSETAVGELIFDLIDSDTPGDEDLEIDLEIIFQTLLGGHKDTPAVTSIHSFLHHLKLAAPEHASQIDELAALQNISAGNEYEGLDQAYYVEVPADGTLVRRDDMNLPLETKDTFGPISTTNAGGNKWLNRVFFRGQTIVGGCHTISALWISGGALSLRSGSLVSSGGNALEFIARPFDEAEPFSFAVSATAPSTRFSVNVNPSNDCAR